MENADPRRRRGKRPPSSPKVSTSSPSFSRAVDGPKRRRRPGPASRALKAFYQQKRQEAARNKRLPLKPQLGVAAASRAAAQSASYEHKYDDEKRGTGVPLSGNAPCADFEFKSQDFEDLMTPRDGLQHSRFGPSVKTADGSSSSTSSCYNLLAPKKRHPGGPSDEIDFYANVPDTARIDLTSM